MEHAAHDHPPAYVSHDPDDLKLPSVPQQDLGFAKCDITLPNLQTVLASIPQESGVKRSTPERLHGLALHSPRSPNGHASPSPKSAHDKQRIKSDASTLTQSDVNMLDRNPRSQSIVSLDDPAVRLAAEALSGLGSAGSSARQSPSDHSLTAPDYNPSPRIKQEWGNGVTPPQPGTRTSEPEPLLNLLVDAHPWVGGTINGSLSAYTTTKNYSPRFVQYGANLIERNIGNPVVSTVSTVGRRTGVENGLRRYLDSRRPSELDGPRDHTKRRKFDLHGGRLDTDQHSECAIDDSSPYTDGSEFLPTYRSSKPPSYREEATPLITGSKPMSSRSRHSHSWSTQLMISTSGLGVALSDNSLQSLTYCVRILNRATEHVTVTMHALRLVVDEYAQTQEKYEQEAGKHEKHLDSDAMSKVNSAQENKIRELADRIKHLCDDIWNTIKAVVSSVSTYAGGALPDNARKLVKSQLLSIPQRWKFASQTAAKQDIRQRSVDSSIGQTERSMLDASAQNAAHRMIVFAEQGIDMMVQVSDVVNVTLKSAEHWLQSLGRSPVKQEDQEMPDADAST